jgi:hypothetical protein
MIPRHLEPEDAVDLGVAPGDENDARLADRLDFPREVEAVAIRKLHVDENQVGASALERLAAFRAAPGFGDLEIVLRKVAGDHRARHRVVFHDDQAVAPLGVTGRDSRAFG